MSSLSSSMRAEPRRTRGRIEPRPSTTARATCSVSSGSTGSPSVCWTPPGPTAGPRQRRAGAADSEGSSRSSSRRFRWPWPTRCWTRQRVREPSEWSGATPHACFSSNPGLSGAATNLSSEFLTLSTSLRERTAAQVSDSRLRSNLARATDAFADRKAAAYAQFADPEEVRAKARAAKGEVLRRLDQILERLADRLEAVGAQVHWARTDEEARDHVRRIVQTHSAHRIVKSKSMLSEEIALNEALEEIGSEVTETDLGEWIIQLAREAPSHIIVPAIHKDRTQVRDTLQRVAEGDLSDVPGELAAFARRELRQRFLQADLGISGVNFAVAESGTLVLVTNEGNGRLATSVPPVHVALLGMERVVETWEQLDLLLALLPRAATGQPITTYVSAITGARRPKELDGRR